MFCTICVSQLHIIYRSATLLYDCNRTFIFIYKILLFYYPNFFNIKKWISYNLYQQLQIISGEKVKLLSRVRLFVTPWTVACQDPPSMEFSKIISFYLFLAVLGLRCCKGFSLLAASTGYSLVGCMGFSLRWLLLWRTGFRHAGLSGCSTGAQQLQFPGSKIRLSSCGAWAYLLGSMWDLPGSGIEPMTPALAAGFLSTEPPGKPQSNIFNMEANIQEKAPLGSVAACKVASIQAWPPMYSCKDISSLIAVYLHPDFQTDRKLELWGPSATNQSNPCPVQMRRPRLSDLPRSFSEAETKLELEDRGPVWQAG